jgi:NCAIR mutase (PurE)-related protein
MSEFIDLDEVQLDIGRQDRCGFPEVIYGEGKTKETILKTFQAFAEKNIDAFATRIDAEKGDFLQQHFTTQGFSFRYNQVARTFRLFPVEPQTLVPQTPVPQGKIAVISAGTSDAPVAEEARETALWTGAEVQFFQDIGVAGPQRFQSKLPLLQDADVVIVVAGMEGALPSVVGGHMSCPVIAVPTSVGYGANFGGLSALLCMLNSCASNVLVVNIDAGFKAGYVAGLIAKKMAAKTRIS